MTDDRRKIALAIYRASRGVIPAAERQALYAFLQSLPGGAPKKRRKIHSWHRKKKPAAKAVSRRRQTRRSAAQDRQLRLPLDE